MPTPAERLAQALEALEALQAQGCRAVRSKDLSRAHELEPARAASQLIRSGRKADAVARLAKAGSARSDDDTYILALMSDLGLADELVQAKELQAGTA